MINQYSEKHSKGRARLIGALFLISYAGVFVGAAIVGSSLDGIERLASIAGDQSRVTAGLLVEMINDIAVIGIAVMFYPLLRRVSEGLALWYVGVRIVEAGLFLVGKVSALSLIPLSEGFLSSGPAEGAAFEGAAELALDQWYWSGELAAVAFMAGAVLLYSLLYRSRLVPRVISVWGLLSVASLGLAKVFDVPDLTQSFEPAMLLYLPIVANELFLAGWLLAKGFRSEPDLDVPVQPTKTEVLVG